MRASRYIRRKRGHSPGRDVHTHRRRLGTRVSSSLLVLVSGSRTSRFQVNDLSTSLLALLLLPKMLHTAEKYQTTPRLVIVSSEVHMSTKIDNEVLGSENPLRMFGSSAEYIPKYVCDCSLISFVISIMG